MVLAEEPKLQSMVSEEIANEARETIARNFAGPEDTRMEIADEFQIGVENGPVRDHDREAGMNRGTGKLASSGAHVVVSYSGICRG